MPDVRNHHSMQKLRIRLPARDTRLLYTAPVCKETKFTVCTYSSSSYSSCSWNYVHAGVEAWCSSIRLYLQEHYSNACQAVVVLRTANSVLQVTRYLYRMHSILCACIHTCIQPSIHPSIRPSVRPSVRPSIHPHIHPSIHPFIHVHACILTFSQCR